MISLTIAVLILGAATSSIMLLARSTAAQAHYVDMNATTRRALEQFFADIRMGFDVSTATSTGIAFSAYDESGSTVSIIYRYDSSAGTLTRYYGGVSSVVLTDITRFSMLYYTLRLTETSAPEEVKEVQIRASLSKDVLNIAKTNEIISARFMMRNRQVSS